VSIFRVLRGKLHFFHQDAYTFHVDIYAGGTRFFCHDKKWRNNIRINKKSRSNPTGFFTLDINNAGVLD
jgi:hypothetical protein